MHLKALLPVHMATKTHPVPILVGMIDQVPPHKQDPPDLHFTPTRPAHQFPTIPVPSLIQAPARP